MPHLLYQLTLLFYRNEPGFVLRCVSGGGHGFDEVLDLGGEATFEGDGEGGGTDHFED